MRVKTFAKSRLGRAIFGLVFAFVAMGALIGVTVPVYAVPEDAGTETVLDETTEEEVGEDEGSETPEETTGNEGNESTGGGSCYKSLGGTSWFMCTITEMVSNAVDNIYGAIKGLLVISPIEIKDGEPIYELWKYIRGVANIVFIIFMLVMIYSQITGLGISNYGLKKALPKLIVSAVLINLSFVICVLAVDLSNIIGGSLKGVFDSVEAAAMGAAGAGGGVSMSEVYLALGGSLSIALVAGVIAIQSGVIFMLIPTVLGAFLAVAIGFLTIALRHAVVVLLIMIAPFAIVAYMLPNTEQWFKKWQQLFMRMLVFYPMFALLFGASSLAGQALIASAKDGFMVLLGLAVKIFPLFFSVQLMKMSGTVLGSINTKLTQLTARPLEANRRWAEARRENRRMNTLASGVTPSARLLQFMNNRKALLEEDTKNATKIATSNAAIYTQQRIANSRIGDMESNTRRVSRYTRNAKAAGTYGLMAENAAMHTEHVIGNYSSHFRMNRRDSALSDQASRAWIDYGRAMYQKDIDDENDVNFLVDKYLAANKRNANGEVADEEAFNRYIRSVTGPEGEERLIAKVITQASKVESKQRAEFSVLHAKYGHNGYNKHAFREWAVGYKINDDGWAIDANGKRLRNADGSYVEIVPGDAITKAPEKLVLYDKRDENGLYFDYRDQDGNVIARVHRGVTMGADGKSVNYDDVAFIKETFANFDIPIADPINNVYGILAGVKPGSVNTPQGPNEIGLSRYSTTIGRAMSAYKENAAWSGSMFNSGIGNRQIGNSAQYAIWALDSIKKTLKPGSFNTQNPASVEFLTAIMNPDNWGKIFTEEDIKNAVNINNEEFGGEDWIRNADGTIDYTPVDNPTYEQRMNTLQRKLLIPAMKKILPAFDRLRTSNTADNQKPGTADEQSKFLDMVKNKWENNAEIPFDPLLVDQDLQLEARAFRQRKHDKNGNLIYATDDNRSGGAGNLMETLTDAYDRSMLPEELIHKVFGILSSKARYSRALSRFEELCNENPDATLNEIRDWFSDLDILT